MRRTCGRVYERPITRTSGSMSDKPTEPQPQDTTETELRLAAFGMSPEAAKTYAAFFTGARWPRPSDF
jgi:hypothetical protein